MLPYTHTSQEEDNSQSFLTYSYDTLNLMEHGVSGIAACVMLSDMTIRKSLVKSMNFENLMIVENIPFTIRNRKISSNKMST